MIAAVQGLPPNVTRAIKEVDHTPYERGEGFAEIIFKNGYKVMRTADQELFVATCSLVYDLPKI